MSGWKEWQVGEVVEAGDFQTYIQDQVVQVYADSSARSSALGTAVSAGMVSYLEASTAVEVYNGSSWQIIAVGDITSVTAGTGLTGGGTSGDVTLNANYSAIGSAITIGKTQVLGTAVVLSDTAVVTNAMLQNNSITLNGTAVALGGTATISGGGGGGGASVTIADTAPGGASSGDLWFNSADASTYLYYDDFWVATSGPQGPTGPTGSAGPAGSAATIAVGSVTTGTAGSSATVTNVGTAGAAIFNFSIPQGVAGSAGPANTLSIGSVTGGTAADATITGTAPSQTLNLILPKGDKGDQGDPGPEGPAGSTITRASITADTATSSTTETAIVSYTIPSNSLTAGVVYRVVGFGVRTGGNNSGATARLRIGTTSLSGAIIAAATHANSATAGSFRVEFMVTVKTTGASGTARGSGQFAYVTAFAMGTEAAQTVDTTVNNIIELTCQAANATNTYTFTSAIIEQVD